jgi:hypothetical protein
MSPQGLTWEGAIRAGLPSMRSAILGASGWFGEDGYATTLTDPKS